MVPRRIHLLDPTFDRIDRTYCGLAGPALTSPTTTDPAEATCKACLKWYRELDQERAALDSFRVGGLDDESMKPTQPVRVMCTRCGRPSAWFGPRGDEADTTAVLSDLVSWARDHRCPRNTGKGESGDEHSQ